MLDTTCPLADPQLYCRQLSELQVQISWDASGFVPPGDALSPICPIGHVDLTSIRDPGGSVLGVRARVSDRFALAILQCLCLTPM